MTTTAVAEKPAAVSFGAPVPVVPGVAPKKSKSEPGKKHTIQAARKMFAAEFGQVSRASSAHTTLPVLAHTLLQVQGTTMVISATNLEIGLIARIPIINTGENWSVTVPCAAMNALLGTLTNDTLDLTFTEKVNELEVKDGKSVTRLKGLPASEFPVAQLDLKDPLELSGTVLARLFSVAFAALGDDSRPNLAGVYIHSVDATLKTVATDGLRMAMTYRQMEKYIGLERGMIIPGAAAQELIRMVGKTENVQVYSDKGRFVACIPDHILYCQLVDGEYPNYTALVPTVEPDAKMIVGVSELSLILKRCSVFNKSVFIDLDPGQSSVIIKATSVETGETRGEITCAVAGKKTTIKVLAPLVLSVLDQIRVDPVEIRLYERCILITAPSSDLYVGLVALMDPNPPKPPTVVTAAPADVQAETQAETA